MSHAERTLMNAKDRGGHMDTSTHRRFRLSICLNAQSHAFVERFVTAGVFESPDEMIAAALDALSRAIEASARRAAIEQGCLGAQDASLEELADMLDEFSSWRNN
jgi:Arc/MetJ-type ribon-helix-helix transcriptional regulator